MEHPLAIVHLKELLAVARNLDSNKRILAGLISRICASRYLSVYLGARILAFVPPTSPKTWYIPDFMNFVPTHGMVTCQVARPIIDAAWPDWTAAPATIGTAIKMTMDLYREYMVRKQMMRDYIKQGEEKYTLRLMRRPA